MKRLKKASIVLNPKAGVGLVKKNQYKDILNTIKSFGWSIEEHVSKSPRDITKYLSRHKTDYIITIGGDGTISEAVNGIMKKQKKDRPRIIPIPYGTGNSFLRDFYPDLNWKEILENAYNGKERKVDLMHLTTSSLENPKKKEHWYCINTIGLAFIADIAEYITRIGKKIGSASYPAALIIKIADFRKYNIKFVLDGLEYEYKEVQLMVVNNSQYAGGAIRTAPLANVSDGKFDIMILHHLTRRSFLMGFPKTFKGTHLSHPNCDYFQGKSFSMIAEPSMHLVPDGELFGQTPFSVEIEKSAVTICV